MIFDEIIESVEKGMKGGNEGIPMGFERLTNFIPNIQKARYHLVVGESGSGKSAFVDTAYVFNPLEWYLKNKGNTDIKLKIFYYSFEISRERLLTKQICRKIFRDYRLLLDVNYILSYGKNRVSDEHFKLVCKYANYFNQLEEYITIKDNSSTNNPTGIYNDLWKYAEENGTISKLNNQIAYKENDPNLYTIVVLDHMALCPKERGFSLKENMDKLSEYTMLLRNKFKFSFCYLVQANRNLGDIERLKMDKSNLAIRQSDIKDSSSPGQDADAILGIINPWKYNINQYRDYDISKLRDRQRFLNIAKSRDGESEKSLGLSFYGECGYFEELPRSTEMTEAKYRDIINNTNKFKERDLWQQS